MDCKVGEQGCAAIANLALDEACCIQMLVACAPLKTVMIVMIRASLIASLAGESHTHSTERGRERGLGLFLWRYRAANMPYRFREVLAGLRLHQSHPGIQAPVCTQESSRRCLKTACQAFGLGALGNLATAEDDLHGHLPK